MDTKELLAIETDVFLDAVNQRYGHDFRHFAKSTLRRKVNTLMQGAQKEHPSELVPLVFHDKSFYTKVLAEFSQPAGELFQTPGFYKVLKPILREHLPAKKPNIWIAGCAGGEEVYSMAILLCEEGLIDTTTILATDFNEVSVYQSQRATFPLKNVKSYAANYIEASGKASFSDYYTTQGNNIVMEGFLSNKISFKKHDIALDGSISKPDLILSRNNLSFFGKKQQLRILKAFNFCLNKGGVLCLGEKESPYLLDAYKVYQSLDLEHRIFQKQ